MNSIKGTLESICKKDKGSIISGPFGSNISSKFFVEKGIPVIRGNNLNLSQIKFNDNGFVFITEEKANELNCDAIKNDLIFTAAGTIGQVGIIPENSKYKRYVISNKQLRARLDNNKVDYLFAYFWFSSPWIQKKLQDCNKGSTVPLLTLSEVKQLPIIYPGDLNLQRRISKILDIITTKIEVNKKINEKLESIVKIVYDYWFLQFEFPNKEGKPYKSSGGKMVYNELLKKEIPEDWEVKCLGDILTKQNRSFEYNKNVKTLDVSVMPSNSFSLNDLNESSNFDTNLFTMKKYDLLFGSIRPYLKKAGIAPCNGAVAGTVHCYTVNKESDYNFALITLCSNNMFNYAINNSKGTKMPIVASDDLLKFLIPYNKRIVESFNKINIKEIISNNIMQNQELTKLRDFLLPLLMNGQVTIQDAEQQVNNTISNIWNAEKLIRFAQWKQMQGYAARGEVDEETLMKIFDAMDKDAKK